jgi:Family of unknown function (DUF6527)
MRVTSFLPRLSDGHMIHVDTPNHLGARWLFNGDMQSPTFSPSVHIVGKCHSFVSAGKIQFLSDCSHELAGRTVELEPFPY